MEGFYSINSEIVTDATNSPNFFAGKSADVGDMLLHGQIVSECYAHIFCLQGKQNISVSYVNEGWVRVWERGSVRGNEHSVLSSFSLSLFDVIHVFTSEMQQKQTETDKFYQEICRLWYCLSWV